MKINICKHLDSLDRFCKKYPDAMKALDEAKRFAGQFGPISEGSTHQDVCGIVTALQAAKGGRK